MLPTIHGQSWSLLNLPPTLLLLLSLTAPVFGDHAGRVPLSPNLHLVNITIDDEFGVYSTGLDERKIPNWRQGNVCPATACVARPDPTRAKNGTWHQGIFIPSVSGPESVTLSFNGSAIYVYFILMNNIAGKVYDIARSNTNLTFSIDNVPEGPNFIHTARANSLDYEYDVLVFNKTFDDISERSIRIETRDLTTVSTLLFDYAVYTTVDIDDPFLVKVSGNTIMSSGHAGAIIAGVLGGLVFLALLTFVFVNYNRRRMYRSLPGQNDDDDDDDARVGLISNMPQPTKKSSKKNGAVTPFMSRTYVNPYNEPPPQPSRHANSSSAIRSLDFPMQTVKPNHARGNSEDSGKSVRYRLEPATPMAKTGVKKHRDKIKSHVAHVAVWHDNAQQSSSTVPTVPTIPAVRTVPVESTASRTSRREEKAQMRREDLQRKMEEMAQEREQMAGLFRAPIQSAPHSPRSSASDDGDRPDTSTSSHRYGTQEDMAREMEALKYEVAMLKQVVVTQPPPGYI